MGFEPKNSHPVKYDGAYLSIMSARIKVAELQAAIAKAELDEQNEYLAYRLKLNDVENARLCNELSQLKLAHEALRSKHHKLKKKRRKS
jgi:hypothetical protein